MTQFHIRDFPDNLVETVDERARATGKSREAWLRDLIIAEISLPIIKERYALQFYNDGGEPMGIIKHLGSDEGNVNNTGGGHSLHGMTTLQIEAFQQAAGLVKRNGPGDRESAIHRLKSHFDNVFEVAV